MEMAIVLAIVGMVAGGVLSIGSAKHEGAKFDLTKSRLDAIEAAIKRHAYAGGFLPCPADPTALPSSASYGAAADCGSAPPAGITSAGSGANEIWIGTIPIRALNLPDSAMYDGWQNRFTYAVVNDLAANPTSFSDYTASATTGVLQMLDFNGTQVTDATTDTVVAYAIVSHGKDKKGAITRAGTLPVACDITAKDGENCDGDAVFRDSRVVDSRASSANYYDDIIRWKTKHFMQPPKGDANLYNSTCVTESLSGGSHISCVINGKDGVPYCWGGQNQGQFGNGTTNLSNPNPITAYGGGSGFKFIDADVSNGQGFTCVINGSSQILCAGKNNVGQLGRGFSGADQPSPAQEGTLANNWSKIIVEQQHSCAINALGQMLCWGQNSDGRLGIGAASTPVDIPTLVAGGFSDWVSMGLSNFGSCGIRGSGVAYCWGANGSQQVGDGTSTQRDAPVLVLGGFTDWTLIRGNNGHYCGLRATGQGYCWGNGTAGRVRGDGTNSGSSTPYEVTGNFTNWTYIAGGFDSSCGIRGGRLYCWGSRASYGIPDGLPVTDPNPTGIVEAAGGFTDWGFVSPTANFGGCASRSNGKIYCWGENSAGSVGNGTTTSTTIPTLVNGLNGCDN